MGLNDLIPAFAGMTIWRIVYFTRGSLKSTKKAAGDKNANRFF
jgi:hypothetical protein